MARKVVRKRRKCVSCDSTFFVKTGNARGVIECPQCRDTLSALEAKKYGLDLAGMKRVNKPSLSTNRFSRMSTISDNDDRQEHLWGALVLAKEPEKILAWFRSTDDMKIKWAIERLIEYGMEPELAEELADMERASRRSEEIETENTVLESSMEYQHTKEDDDLTYSAVDLAYLEDDISPEDWMDAQRCLVELVKITHMPVKDLAKRIGVGKRMIYKVLNGEKPTPKEWRPVLEKLVMEFRGY